MVTIGSGHGHDVADVFTTQALATPFVYHDRARTLVVHQAVDVEALIRDDRLWNQRGADDRLADLSPAMQTLRTEFRAFVKLWPAFSGGSYHERIRSELADGLAGTAAGQPRRRMARSVAELLPPDLSEPFDWVSAFARPYALHILAGTIGVDVADTERLARLGAAILDVMAASPSDVPGLSRALAAVDGLHRWLETAIERPAGSRLLSALARIWTAPDLGPRAATAALTQVVTGSTDPLVSVLCVLVARTTREDLRRLPIAVIREEVIRLATPFRYAVRYARCPMQVGGHTLAEGDRLVLNLATANVDPAVLPEPLAIARRQPQSHLALGAGTHYCLGAGSVRAAVDAVLLHLRERRQSFHCERVIRAPELPTLRYSRVMVQPTAPDSPQARQEPTP